MYDPDELDRIREAKAEWEETTLGPTLERLDRKSVV